MSLSTAQAGQTSNRHPGKASQFAPKKRYGLLFVILLLAASYFLYMPSLRFGWVWDDHYFIAQNQHLTSWHYLPVYFTQQAWSHVTNVPGNLYRPLLLVWLRLNYMVFGLQPAAFHLTTVLVNVVTVGLVYRLAHAVLQHRATALFAGLLFALHPVHAEVAAWICSVPESLGSALVLGAFLSYLVSLPQNGRAQRPMAWRILSLALFTFALLMKETSAVLPMIILSYELTLGKDGKESGVGSRIRLWHVAQRLAPFLALLGVYLVARGLALGSLAHSANNVPLLSSMRAWPWLLFSYARLLLWPANLSPLYDPVSIARWSEVRFLLPVLAMLVVGAGLWRWKKRTGARLALFCALWFLITLAPALAASSFASPSEQFHDRYLYLPSVAFVLLVAAALRSLFQTGNSLARIAVPAAGAVLCVMLGLATLNQIRYWENDRVLFERANLIAPRNELGKMNLVNELMKTREYQRALQLSEDAVAFNPGSARALGSAGAAAFYTGDYFAAERYYSSAIQLDPSQVRYFQYLGLTRMRMNNNTGAVEALTRALALAPQQPGLHYSLGSALAKLVRWREASEEFRQELRIDPANQAVLQALHAAQAR